eukprot:784839-Pelagomonas_calceolata.AAC.1
MESSSVSEETSSLSNSDHAHTHPTDDAPRQPHPFRPAPWEHPCAADAPWKPDGAAVWRAGGSEAQWICECKDRLQFELPREVAYHTRRVSAARFQDCEAQQTGSARMGFSASIVELQSTHVRYVCHSWGQVKRLSTCERSIERGLLGHHQSLFWRELLSIHSQCAILYPSLVICTKYALSLDTVSRP